MKSRRIAPFAAAVAATVVALTLGACQPVPPPKAYPAPTTTTTVPIAPAPGTQGAAVVAAARTQLGQPYRSGGESRAEGGFDCSGLTYFAWKSVGVTLPRTSASQYAGTTRIKKTELRPGDLVFYSSSGPRGRVSHVALFAGKDVIIHARKPGIALREDKFSTYWTNNLVGYGRVKTSSPAA